MKVYCHAFSEPHVCVQPRSTCHFGHLAGPNLSAPTQKTSYDLCILELRYSTAYTVRRFLFSSLRMRKQRTNHRRAYVDSPKRRLLATNVQGIVVFVALFLVIGYRVSYDVLTASNVTPGQESKPTQPRDYFIRRIMHRVFILLPLIEMYNGIGENERKQAISVCSILRATAARQQMHVFFVVESYRVQPTIAPRTRHLPFTPSESCQKVGGWCLGVWTQNECVVLAD